MRHKLAQLSVKPFYIVGCIFAIYTTVVHGLARHDWTIPLWNIAGVILAILLVHSVKALSARSIRTGSNELT